MIRRVADRYAAWTGERAEAWQDRAACVGSPPAWWSIGSSPRDIERGKRVCAECPVAGDCYADAVSTGARGVVRAGVPMLEDRGPRTLRRCAECDGPYLSVEGPLYCTASCAAKAGRAKSLASAASAEAAVGS